MRTDMHDVLKVGRTRAKCRFKGTEVYDIEDAPVRESMRPQMGWKRHNWGRINPLRGYLAKQVGRPWNEVYSEICGTSGDVRNRIKFDLRQKLDNLVETNVIMVDGKPIDPSGRFSSLWSPFWVHPDTGVLMKSPERTRRNRYRGWYKDFKQVPIDATHKYVEIDGLWYIITFAPFTREAYEGTVTTTFQRGVEGGYDNLFKALTSLRYFRRIRDVVFGDKLRYGFDDACRQLSSEWGSAIYACHKRQIGSREAKMVAAKWAAMELERQTA